jgi:hypothetical protein
LPLSSNKLGPLYKKLNTSKSCGEKEDLKKQIKKAKEDVLKAKKEALAEIVKAYELLCIYFIGKAWTQWDKVVSKMHMEDPWVAVNGASHKGPRVKTRASLLDCIELYKLTIFSCDVTELQRHYMQQYVKKPQRDTVHAFMACMGLLNEYLAHLPTVKDSLMAVEDSHQEG